MTEKTFILKDGYIHIPIKSRDEKGITVDIIADGEKYAQFYIPIEKNTDECDFYTYLDFSGYKEIKLICKDCDDDSIFDGIIQGKNPDKEPALYPELYKESLRQQIHYSPKRGWVNDPNGLFYNDGVFNLYCQHNPLDNRHFGVDISWGHAKSRDGVHFTELPVAILPDDVNYIVASGSALVDEDDISGFGKGTIIAAYTKLIGGRCLSLHPEIIEGEGQIVVYSTDGGITFKRITDDITVPAPPKTYWRDPKLIQIDENTIGMAVYETFEGENCVSFYKSNDCRKWEFCSRNMDLYECPDLFCLDVIETGEKLWVLYGGNGKYRIGNFENFVFTPVSGEGFLDYGDSVYAGQTYNNFPDEKRRMFTAWIREDTERETFDVSDGRKKHFGFSQAMNLMSELSIHKVNDGYRVFRKPIKEIDSLRESCTDAKLSGIIDIPCPGEAEFTVVSKNNIKILADKILFCYNAENRTINNCRDKEYSLSTEGDFNLRIIADTNSVEIFVADEIVMTYFCDVKNTKFSIECDKPLDGRVYRLNSIWER